MGTETSTRAEDLMDASLCRAQLEPAGPKDGGAPSMAERTAPCATLLHYGPDLKPPEPSRGPSRWRAPATAEGT